MSQSLGPNGAGKTTLARVLLGLYRPHARQHSCRRDTVNRREPSSVVNTAAVPCFRTLPSTTLPHVRTLPSATSNTLNVWKRHQSRGGAASVVDGLTDGYETVLGPTFGGRDLSGGEWQRLATARSFMRETPWLVVLDEPTAALDPLAEQAVYERFIERSAGRTSVLISHRLSSVRTCDRILVLDNGSIVEDGDHETLLAKDGLYAQFFKAQAQWYV